MGVRARVGGTMRQGDIYWYTFRQPDKRRPVLILTRNSVIPCLTGITVATITSNIRGNRSEVVLTPEEDGVLVRVRQASRRPDHHRHRHRQRHPAQAGRVDDEEPGARGEVEFV